MIWEHLALRYGREAVGLPLQLSSSAREHLWKILHSTVMLMIKWPEVEGTRLHLKLFSHYEFNWRTSTAKRVIDSCWRTASEMAWGRHSTTKPGHSMTKPRHPTIEPRCLATEEREESNASGLRTTAWLCQQSAGSEWKNKGYFERRVVEFERQLSQRVLLALCSGQATTCNIVEVKLRWREGEKAPCEMDRYCDAVVGGGVVYCGEVIPHLCDKIHAYKSTTSKWSLIPDCPVYSGFALAVINGTVTTVVLEGMERMARRLTSCSGWLLLEKMVR